MVRVLNHLVAMPSLQIVRGGPIARWASVLIGCWLFLSPWILHRPDRAHHVIGLCVATIGLAGMLVPTVRYMNAAIAVMLVVTAISFHRQPPRLLWSDILSGFSLLSSSLLPTLRRRRSKRVINR